MFFILVGYVEAKGVGKMIQTVSNFSVNKSNVGLGRSKNLSKVVFKGNPLSLESKLLGKNSENAIKTVSEVFKNSIEKTLPISKKPKVAADVEKIADTAETLLENITDAVPGLGQVVRGVKLSKSISDGDKVGAINNGVGIVETSAKQATALTVAAFCGPLAPVGYVATIVGWNFIRKNIVKGIFGK